MLLGINLFSFSLQDITLFSSLLFFICILDGNVIWDDHFVFRMTYLVF